MLAQTIVKKDQVGGIIQESRYHEKVKGQRK